MQERICGKVLVVKRFKNTVLDTKYSLKAQIGTPTPTSTEKLASAVDHRAARYADACGWVGGGGGQAAVAGISRY